jgi:hypothetical protein
MIVKLWSAGTKLARNRCRSVAGRTSVVRPGGSSPFVHHSRTSQTAAHEWRVALELILQSSSCMERKLFL